MRLIALKRNLRQKSEFDIIWLDDDNSNNNNNNNNNNKRENYMPTKLNSYTIQDNIIDKMKTILEQTKKDGIEHGFDLCSKDNDLVIRNICEGDKCHIKLVKKCEKGEILAGSYHTHPKGTLGSWSPDDMHGACEEDFSCLGYNWYGKGRIKCIVRKSDTNTEKCKEDIAPGGRYNIQSYASRYHQLLNKYFKQVYIT